MISKKHTDLQALKIEFQHDLEINIGNYPKYINSSHETHRR